ncbi:MAG: metal-sulfur cluster assembly factor [Vulcanimicrobiaceae bacterium]
MSRDLQHEVREALRGVIDPELGIDIVNLGLVYDIDVKEADVDIVMTLTVPGCPMHMTIIGDVKSTIEALPWVREARVHLVFDPPWTPARLTKEAHDLLGR